MALRPTPRRWPRGSTRGLSDSRWALSPNEEDVVGAGVKRGASSGQTNSNWSWRTNTLADMTRSSTNLMRAVPVASLAILRGNGQAGWVTRRRLELELGRACSLVWRLTTSAHWCALKTSKSTPTYLHATDMPSLAYLCRRWCEQESPTYFGYLGEEIR